MFAYFDRLKVDRLIEVNAFKKKICRILIQQCRALRQLSRYLIHDKKTLKSYDYLLLIPVLFKNAVAS